MLHRRNKSISNSSKSYTLKPENFRSNVRAETAGCASNSVYADFSPSVNSSILVATSIHLTSRLERDPHTDLDLAARRRGLGDRPELRRVHEAAGRAQVRVIERVEEFGPELEFRLLGQAELAGQRQVERLHSGAVDRIPPRVPEPERRRGGERRRVEPTVR